jgi:hypothetical protein
VEGTPKSEMELRGARGSAIEINTPEQARALLSVAAAAADNDADGAATTSTLLLPCCC